MWNKTIFRVESFLRRSWFARAYPIIKIRLPFLHNAIIQARDRLFPYKAETELTRYQFRAIHRFLELTSNDKALDVVLEIGSDLEGNVGEELITNGAQIVVGVNPQLGLDGEESTAAMHSSIHLIRADARWLPLKENSVSSIFSVATFEHIYNLDLALGEMWRVLRPGGIVYTDFGPIWSSSVGHHVYAKVGDEEARHWKPGLNPVPNYGHLLFSAVELRTKLEKTVSPALLDAIISWIYEQDGINRIFFEDYIKSFEQSDFEIVAANKILEYIDPTIEKVLQEKYDPYREFGCRMLEVMLLKAHTQ